ncbi:UNVERIFIED_CONTAM: hypothetical protein RKD50_000242 [Streptomyces canus]
MLSGDIGDTGGTPCAVLEGGERLWDRCGLRHLRPDAPLTPTGRPRLARCVADEGWPVRRAAERFQVSHTTAALWAGRYRYHGAEGPCTAEDPGGPADSERSSRLRCTRRASSPLMTGGGLHRRVLVASTSSVLRGRQRKVDPSPTRSCLAPRLSAAVSFTLAAPQCAPLPSWQGGGQLAHQGDVVAIAVLAAPAPPHRWADRVRFALVPVVSGPGGTRVHSDLVFRADRPDPPEQLHDGRLRRICDRSQDRRRIVRLWRVALLQVAPIHRIAVPTAVGHRHVDLTPYRFRSGAKAAEAGQPSVSVLLDPAGSPSGRD